MEANVPLPIRCWSSVELCGRRTRTADPSTALLMNKLESALDKGSNVPHSSQTRLEWATLPFLGSDQSPLRRICSLPASRKAEGGPLKPFGLSGGHPAPKLHAVFLNEIRTRACVRGCRTGNPVASSVDGLNTTGGALQTLSLHLLEASEQRHLQPTYTGVGQHGANPANQRN